MILSSKILQPIIETILSDLDALNPAIVPFLVRRPENTALRRLRSGATTVLRNCVKSFFYSSAWATIDSFQSVTKL